MRLIGMLDSPYVRRVAISLETLSVPFSHESVSVFSTFDKFKKINPVVKAPTLVCDDSTVIMDSSLILQFIEANASKGKSLWSSDAKTLQCEFRVVSLALAACEKSVQIIYERKLRPASAQYEPWIERVSGQLAAAYTSLETELSLHPEIFSSALNQASITSAVAWQFTLSMLGDKVAEADHPGLALLSERLEQTDAFLKFPPDGPGVVKTN